MGGLSVVDFVMSIHAIPERGRLNAAVLVPIAMSVLFLVTWNHRRIINKQTAQSDQRSTSEKDLLTVMVIVLVLMTCNEWFRLAVQWNAM